MNGKLLINLGNFYSMLIFYLSSILIFTSIGVFGYINFGFDLLTHGKIVILYPIASIVFTVVLLSLLVKLKAVFIYENILILKSISKTLLIKPTDIESFSMEKVVESKLLNTETPALIITLKNGNKHTINTALLKRKMKAEEIAFRIKIKDNKFIYI